MLHLAYCGQTTLPVEVEGILPETVRELSRADIERLSIYHGNVALPLAELFRVQGDPSDARIEWTGDLSGVHWLGAGMTTGNMHVAGPVGRHVGSAMRGGEIQIAGDASDWAGAEMHGGILKIAGRAGNQAGGAYRGSPRGMTGGVLLIAGDAGLEAGHTMRRGLIAVGGSVGDLAGFNLRAGTLLVFGTAGVRCGAGMRRGTIAILGKPSPPLVPSFSYACRVAPPFLRLATAELQRHGFAAPVERLREPFERYSGDLLEGGRGELFLPAA